MDGICVYVCVSMDLPGTPNYKDNWREFPGPMGGILLFTAGGQVPSLIRELGSHKPCGVAKKEKDSESHYTDLGSDFSKRGCQYSYHTKKYPVG